MLEDIATLTGGKAITEDLGISSHASVMPSRSSRSRSRRAGREPWRATLEQSGTIAIQRLVPLTDLVFIPGQAALDRTGGP